MIPILLFEDQADLCQIIKETFLLYDFEVTYSLDGSNAAKLFITIQPKLVIVDIMMPGTDGFSAISAIRSVSDTVPILVLTAKPQTQDLLKAYELGCNDYVRKPFVMEELIARVKSFVKPLTGVEPARESQTVFKIGHLLFNVVTQELRSTGKVFNLSYKETEMLKRFCLQPNKVVNRRDLLVELWGSDDVFNSKTMNVYINKLRNYFLEDPSIALLTIHGIGYKLVVKSDFSYI